MPEDTAASGVGEQAIADYLCEHPGFFDCCPDVLLELSLGHRPGAEASSLVQRQLVRLRRSNGELETRLRDLARVAQDNRELAGKIHRLVIALLPPTSAAKRIEHLRRSLTRDFSVDSAALVLFTRPAHSDAEDGFVKIVQRRDPGLKKFARLLDSAQPRCGPLLSRHKAFVFGERGMGLESAAMIPLGEGARLGFLVIASRDPERFNRGQHVDFLRLIGDVVAPALTGNQTPAGERPKADGG